MGKNITAIEAPYIYELEIKLARICATQNAEFDTRTEMKKLGYENEQETRFKNEAAEPESEDNKVARPAINRKTSKKRKDTQMILTHCFMRNNGHIIEPLGGTFGHIKRTLRAAAKNIGLAKYKQPAVELIKFEPEMIDLGKDENITLTPVLEPRSRGSTRELVYYETATDRTFRIKMTVSKTCPLTAKELTASLTALKDYDGFGASKRGIITSIDIMN